MNVTIRNFAFFLTIFYSGYLYADYRDDVAHTKLAVELGTTLPKGNGVLVTQTEAATSFVDHDNNSTTPSLAVYLPNPSFFSGKSIVDKSGYASGTYSDHAGGVGGYYYGGNTMAPSITTIHAYWADHWLSTGYLNYGAGKPFSSSSRVANHSWIGSITDLAAASNILRRIDWVIKTDEFIQIVGVNNSVGLNNNLLSAAYNVLAVGKTDGNHTTGSPAVDSTYPAGRTRTEIVAPLSSSSESTPVVAAAAALLVELGHANLGLSTDPSVTSTSNRSGNTIYNAERSEVIKAALLAGADRVTQNTSTAANITDYRAVGANQTNNGLDSRFGAGQVNVYNSYHIIAGGEQNSSQDGGAGSSGIGVFGFDYDPAFGGASGSNNVASYNFSTGTSPKILSAALVWNIDINGGNGPSFSGTATFRDLDLYLYDVTGAQTLLISSTSQIDNSENIWKALSANRSYLLQVIPKAGQVSFSWDYALAWQLETDTDGDGIGNSIDTDDDNDGLTDTYEQSIGTNPLLVDTDNDGFSDFEEVNAGSNPLDINSVPATADGDLNNDGVVNVADVLLGQRILTGLVPLTADLLAHGDVAPLINNTPSPNGVFNAGDLVVIQRKALGTINF